mmetsp:Transcript_16440/g.29187  ORF Transcript_16440/g.29187 Transcript_16440/m.29187 type:complete len:230 (-) Transcript_16440:302-991(-)
MLAASRKGLLTPCLANTPRSQNSCRRSLARNLAGARLRTSEAQLLHLLSFPEGPWQRHKMPCSWLLPKGCPRSYPQVTRPGTASGQRFETRRLLRGHPCGSCTPQRSTLQGDRSLDRSCLSLRRRQPGMLPAGNAAAGPRGSLQGRWRPRPQATQRRARPLPWPGRHRRALISGRWWHRSMQLLVQQRTLQSTQPHVQSHCSTWLPRPQALAATWRRPRRWRHPGGLVP